MKSEQFLEEKIASLEYEFESIKIKSYSSKQLQSDKKKQLTNSSKSIGNGVNPNLVVGVLDTTLFGNGKEGALFTGKYVFVKGTVKCSIDLSRLKNIDYQVNKSVRHKIKESYNYQLIWRYQDDDKTNELSSDAETDGNLFYCINKILTDFSINVGNEGVEETDHGLTLLDLGDDAVFQYLKVIYIYLNGANNPSDRVLRNYVMLQSQLNVSDEVDKKLREYRLSTKSEDLTSQIEKLKALIPEGSQNTILQSLVNDILSTFNNDELDNCENNSELAYLIKLTGVTNEQTNFFIRSQRLNNRQLNEKLTDSEVNELTKKLLIDSKMSPIMPLVATGVSISALGELGTGTLAVAASTGGIGLAVLGIGAAGVAAYKGIEPHQTKYRYRNELLQAKVVKLSNSQQVIIKDINYLTDKVVEESRKTESNSEKIKIFEEAMARIKKHSDIGKEMAQEKVATSQEQIILELPEHIDREKVHTLVQSHTLGNEIENQILKSYDDDGELLNNQSVSNLGLLLNRLNVIDYTKAATIENVTVAGKKLKNMANSLIQRHTKNDS